MAKKILYWIFYASRPLTMSEILHAISIEVGNVASDEDGIPDEGLVLSICTGLAVYEKEPGYLALVHYTLQQYFELKAEAHFPEAQVDIARVCLTYLSLSEFESGPCPYDHLFKNRMHKRPLLRYAVPNWGAHAQGNAEELCQDMILSFLSNDAKLSSSVQVLYVRNLAGQVYSHRFPNNVTTVWIASFYGLTLTVRHLIRNGADVIAKTTTGHTALHRAAGSGHDEVVRLLLDKGADASAADKSGNTPLHLAAAPCCSDLITFMYVENGHQFAHEIPWHSSRTIVLSLLAKGADVNAVNDHGETALHWAINDGQAYSTQLLLEHGADMTMKNSIGLAPLSTAAHCGLPRIARVLVQYDLDKQIQHGILADASQRAATRGYSLILRCLLETPYDRAATDSEGRTLLHRASFGGNIQCIQELLSHGFGLDTQDTQKRTCLHHAAMSPKSSGAIHYLLAKGLNPHQEDIDGWTPLLWATKGGLAETIEVLSAAGTSIPLEPGRNSDPTTNMSSEMNIMVAEALRPVKHPPLSMIGKHPITAAFKHSLGVICDGCEMVRRHIYVLSSSIVYRLTDCSKVHVRSSFQVLHLFRLRLLLQMFPFIRLSTSVSRVLFVQSVR